MIKQFDDTMLAVKAKTKATGAEFQALCDKAKELGATTRFSATQAAKGMDYLAMTGYKTNEISFIAGVIDNEVRYISGILGNEFEYMGGVIANELLYMRGVVANEIAYIGDKFAEFKSFLQENESAVRTTAAVLGVVFGPALIKTGVQAGIAGAKIAAQFTTSVIRAGVQAGIAGIKTSLSFGLALLYTGIQAVAAARRITGSLIVSMARYAAQGWKTILVVGMQCGAWIMQRGVMLATAIAQNVMTLATGTWTLACGIASIATWALGAAFTFLTGPIGLVILGIAALAAAGVWLYNNWDTVRTFFINLWENPSAKFLMFVTGPIGLIIGAVSAIIANWDTLKAWFILLWNDPATAVEQFITGFKRQLGSACEWAKKKWAGVKEALSHPIDTVINFVSGGDPKPTGIDHNATGTNYFSGGLTEVNERGGEIIDLPRGSRIYPAVTTQRMLQQEFKNTNTTSKSNINISGITFVVREEADFDKIADALVRKLEMASMNAGVI